MKMRGGRGKKKKRGKEFEFRMGKEAEQKWTRIQFKVSMYT